MCCDSKFGGRIVLRFKIRRRTFVAIRLLQAIPFLFVAAAMGQAHASEAAMADPAPPRVVPPRVRANREVGEPPRVRANREVDVGARAELAQDAGRLDELAAAAMETAMAEADWVERTQHIAKLERAKQETDQARKKGQARAWSREGQKDEQDQARARSGQQQQQQQQQQQRRRQRRQQ